MHNRWWAAPVLAVAVLGLAACGSTGTSSTPPASPAAAGSSPGSGASSDMASGIKTMQTSIGTLLTDSQGFVLYWFARDTPTTSMCTGTCATYWPPLTGTPSLAAGVTLPGKLGTIKRSDGTTQATYEGHPLYTYKADTSAGMASGNGLNLSGGLWWAMTPNGNKAKGTAPAPQPSASTSSGSGGGYGY